METPSLLILIPSLLSLLGSFSYLYIYFKIPSIHLAFGMKYLLFIQTTDFFFSISNILGSFPVAFSQVFCQIYYFTSNYLINLQSSAISYYFIYLYQVIYLNKPDNPKTMKIFLAILLLIPAIEPSLFLQNIKFTHDNNFCKVSKFGLFILFHLT